MKHKKPTKKELVKAVQKGFVMQLPKPIPLTAKNFKHSGFAKFVKYLIENSEYVIICGERVELKKKKK